LRPISMRRIASFLIAAALIAVMVGCGDGNGSGSGSGSGSGNGSGNGGSDDNGGDAGESYTLTIDSTAGGVVAVDNSIIAGRTMFTYGPGTVLSLSATADGGYQFVRWTGDLGTIDDVHASDTAITMNGNYYILANFEVARPLQYRLAIFSATGGSVTNPGENGFTYDAGTVVNLVATPGSGYEFDEWTGDVDTIADVNAASTTITMNDNYYICAHFRHIPCPGLG
jgi:hypothetical protein